MAWPRSKEDAAEAFWPLRATPTAVSFRPAYFDYFNMLWRNIHVYLVTCRGRQLEVPEFMVFTKKEVNDIRDQRLEQGLPTAMWWKPEAVGRSRADPGTLGFAK